MIKGNFFGGLLIQLTQEDLNNIMSSYQNELNSILQQLERVDCPLCGSADKEHILDTNGQGCLGKCNNCNVIYAYVRPTEEVTNILYKRYLPSNLTDIETRKSQLITRPKEINDDLDWLECYIDRGKLLDVGAASGDFLAYARVRGWEVEATELSTLCSKFIADALNIQVSNGNILDIEFEKEKYNAITLRHCIEHLREPVKELKVLHGALDKDGVLFITTPRHAEDIENLKKNHMLPLHLVNYTKETINFLLKETGFRMVSYESLGAVRSNDEVLNMRVIAMKEC